MKNVSNEFKTIEKAGGPFYAYAKCTLLDGTELTFDGDSDFYAEGNSFTESGGSGFPLGVALSKQITITLDNHDERYSEYDFFGAKIVLYTEADLPDGTQERVLEGTFTVIDSVAPGDALEINAYDNMYKLDADFTSSLSYPVAIQQLWNELCDYYDLGNGSPTFLNDNYVIQSRPETTTGREMAGYIAQIAAGNAYVNANGQLCIKTYDFSPFDNSPTLSGGEIGESVPDTVSAGSFGDGLSEILSGGEFGESLGYYILSDFTTAPEIATDDVTITGITTVIEDEESGEETTLIYGTDDYSLEIDNPLILGNEEQAITVIGQALKGVTIRPFSGDFSPAPSLEFMDMVVVIDRKNNIYPSFVTEHTFTYLGGSSISNGTESPERNAASYSSNATQIYKKVQKQLVRQKTAWETAMEQLSEQVANASGLYTTEEEQPDGSTIFYMHNKPELGESDIIWEMTAETLTVSTDGGKSWNAGITVNGEVIAQIMNTIGINFDWGVGGTLIIEDAEGNQTAYIDANTGTINLSVQTLRIGGKTVEQIVSDEMGDYQPINLILSNEYQGIATDANGDYDIFPSVQTTAQAYYGQQNITDSCTFTITASSGVTGSWNDSTHTYTVTGLTTDDGWVDITATYLDILTTTKRFSMSKIKGGENSRSYYVQCDAQIIKVVTDDTLDPNCINLSAYYREGLASQPYAGRFKIEELQGDSWVSVYQSASDESTVKRYLYGAIRDAAGNVIVNAAGNAIAVLRNIDEIRVTFYAAGGFDTVITVLSIPVVDTVASLSQKDTFNLLTNNGVAKGIYMVGNELYINATYLATGILTDLLGRNYWNLNTGEFALSPSTTVGGETVQEIADSAVNEMTQSDVFNKLTNNGSLPGIFMQNGQLYVNASYIGAGTLLADYIKGGTLSLGGSNNANGVLKILNSFGAQIGKWDKDGIFATNVDISGKIQSQEGQIGGWKILGSALTNGISFTNEKNNNATGLGTYGSNWAFWAGNGKFAVTQDGHAYAQDIFAEGEISALTGKIGDWEIYNGSLSNGIPFTLEENNNSTGMGTYGTDWAFWAGNGKFTVKTNGALRAKNAEIDGTINANSGVFNSVTIQNSSFSGSAGNISGGTYSNPYVSSGTLASTGGTYVGNCSGSALSNCNLGNTTLYSGNGDAYVQAYSQGVLLIRGANGVRIAPYVYLMGETHISTSCQVEGNFEVTGTKNRAINSKDFGKVLLDAHETPAPTFSDYGTGTIDDTGKGFIVIDPIFAETVNKKRKPVTFLTKYGQGDIWVDEENSTHDIVVVNGTPGLKFSWEIKYLQANCWEERLRKNNPESFIYEKNDFSSDFIAESKKEEIDYPKEFEEFIAVEQSMSVDYGMEGFKYYQEFERRLIS